MSSQLVEVYENLAISCACFIVIHNILTLKPKQRRWWQTELFRNRYRLGGRALMRDLMTRPDWPTSVSVSPLMIGQKPTWHGTGRIITAYRDRVSWYAYHSPSTYAIMIRVDDTDTVIGSGKWYMSGPALIRNVTVGMMLQRRKRMFPGTSTLYRLHLLE